MTFLGCDTHSPPQVLPCFLFLCPSTSFAGKENQPPFRIGLDKQDILLVYVFVCFTSQSLPASLALASPEPHCTHPRWKEKIQLRFPEALSTGLFLLSVGAGFSQGIANPIPIYVRKQGPENACIACEKLQADFPGTVPLMTFTSLYTSPDPEIEASYFPDGIAVLYWMADVAALPSVELLLNSLENCESISNVSDVILSPAVLNAGPGRRI